MLKMAAVSVPALWLSGSSVPRYERLYKEYGRQVMDISNPPTDEEIAVFAGKKLADVQAPFIFETTDAVGDQLSAKYITTHTDRGTNHGFVMSRVPWDKVQRGKIYYHSLAGPEFDLHHWANDFKQMFDEETAVIVPLAQQQRLTVGDKAAVTGGLATDAGPADSLRIIHAALEASPHLKEIPWDVAGISMGGSVGYSAMQWWENFAQHYALPEQVEKVTLYAPYTSIIRPDILTDVLRGDPAVESPGLPLVLKWAIQDEMQAQIANNGQRYEAGKFPIERLLAADAGPKKALRQRMMNVSPGYHALARRSLGIPLLQTRYRISYSGLDPVIPPEQSLASSELLEQSARSVETIALPGFHCMAPWDKQLMRRM
jgi:hypothetical protein